MMLAQPLQALQPQAGNPLDLSQLKNDAGSLQQQPTIQSRNGSSVSLSSLLARSTTNNDNCETDSISNDSDSDTTGDHDEDARKQAEEEPAPRRKVQFQAVAIREYSRAMGDNPSAYGGTPLGLDWHYKDETRIDIDDYEEASLERRKKRILKILKLQEKSRQLELSQQQRVVQRRASTGNINSKDGAAAEDEKEKSSSTSDLMKHSPSCETLTEEQMKQLSARWLRIQPVPQRTRERIILEQTMTSKSEIDKMNKSIRKLRNQRQTTIAMSETGIDEWQTVAEFLKRRVKRLVSGVSKQQEQEMLWEKAQKYWEKECNKEDASTQEFDDDSSVSEEVDEFEEDDGDDVDDEAQGL